MASTDLITYLNYMSTWDTESDANIDQLITEQTLFIGLQDFESDSVVDSEFNTLNDLACEVRDLTIAADAIQMAADAAAVASIWSFGLGMAAFVALEAAEQIDKAVISSKSGKLNEKLTSADSDISSQISPNVASYVSKYKENNNLIISKAPKGLDTTTCRSNLMQFMAEIQRKSGKLDAATFRQYAESARIVYNSDEINKVYDALDQLNFSAKSDADVKKFMDVLVGLQLPSQAKFGLTLVTSMSIAIMFYKLKIANTAIKAQAEAAGIPVEEVNTSAFEAMDAVGKFAAVVTVVMSVVDVVLNIIDIVDVVAQCKKMCDQLNGPIKASYKTYFNGIKTAAQQYREAIGAPTPPPQPPVTGNSAGKDIDQMHAQIAQYGSITQFGVRISTISGTANTPSQSTGLASKTDHGFGGYNGTWQVGNWGDTLRFTQ
ncbi:hypothetical protein [Rahnella woolbedingensis]|uniref:Uncharacterized protein n=1 Tax=Rahnella woolbedingensis TaxID=1510574 RepID=A0A419N2Z3_9GAMM|nr:hypothetical protein [Rahnella woolbedingensis]RJT36283.1 hypothetical protein D6C13_22710 [Rahnella woolbedingensis]